LSNLEVVWWAGVFTGLITGLVLSFMLELIMNRPR